MAVHKIEATSVSRYWVGFEDEDENEGLTSEICVIFVICGIFKGFEFE
jgi:hypothetical protein